MQSHCRECGAPIPRDATCQHNFHELLYRENEVGQMPFTSLPQDSMRIAHFYAVSCYIIQHPDSMGYTQASLCEARKNLSAHLNSEISLTELLAQLHRDKGQNQSRIKRRPQEAAPIWNVHTWPMTVAAVLSAPATPAAYVDAVSHWAATTIDTIAHIKAPFSAQPHT